MHELYGYDYHPYVTIWCESLAVLPRCTRKAVHLMEPDQYFLWKDYELGPLCEYLRARCVAWLDDQKSACCTSAVSVGASP